MPATNSVRDSAFDLWKHLTGYPASQTDAALTDLQEWISKAIDADNVIWIGAVRVLHGKEGKKDAFLGWRLRDRVALKPDPEPYRKQLAQYYDTEHYGKLTPTYYERSHEEKKEDHVGMDSRASMSGCGHFRVFRIRDKRFLDFAEFKKTPHYKRYYEDGGITDRILVGFPVGPDHESLFLIDRFHAKPPARLFTLREATLAGDAVRGVPELHRRLFLGNGLMMGDKLLSPMERQILRGLLNGLAEKEIAMSTGQQVTTLHKYVTALYTRFGVKSRPGLMALWLGVK
ncbi:helix-turn-helix transcriptional regulator [Luteolibacter yonseiensis]|uniref:Helix-turn-helix transcriptional regulator n=1 Tax=Luteolibacter yonseiensis TaxID=1144680 RepID=A0A934R4W6_9BACT|nr:helix-turn-helix transcriptional regulator [Luteolibacter yonseiensis]MBK1817002.1 helix-turn-helix transcriptional regulator [Luteolibacter yonseiensis]